MERKSAGDYPQQVLDLFDCYVHGILDRRQFLDGAKKFAVGGMSALTMLETLRPNYAFAQQVAPDDAAIRVGYATYASPQGSGAMRGYLAQPADTGKKYPGVVVVHENRGLNLISRMLPAASPWPASSHSHPTR